MVRAAVKKRKTRRSSQKKSQFLPAIKLTSVISALLILVFLIFSISMLFYVIFFRVVVAAELQQESSPRILFEEPDGPADTDFHLHDDRVFSESPRVAIIIDDMGYHRYLGEQLIDLPASFSFSFLPHAPHTAELEASAYRKGKTVLLHLPLEPRDSQWNPGPGTLYVEEAARLEQLFEQNISLVPHATGVNNHMGSRYTEIAEVMKPLLEMVHRRGLFFVDSVTTSRSVGYHLARNMGLRVGKRTLFLDNVQESEEICLQMKKLADLALEKGYAIGIGHPYKETLVALSTCLADIEKSTEIVGVEQLVQ